MVSAPLVSIVTPTLNQGALIEDTLRSIRAQSYSNLEHVIVDGGSSDGTLAVLKRYEGTYRMSWLSEPDSGMYDAVNKGMLRASGEILAYLNSDDLYFPWTVELVVRAFEEHPEVELVYGDAMVVREGTRETALLLYPPVRPGYLRRTGFLCQPTAFWRRRAFLRLGGFDPSLNNVGDCDFWMRFEEARLARRLDEVLAIERFHPGAKAAYELPRVERELRAVRARHVRTDGSMFVLRRIADRAYGFVWRRRLLGRLLRSAAVGRGGWRGALDGWGALVSWRRAPLAFLPGGSASLSRIIDVDACVVLVCARGSSGTAPQ